MSISKKFWLLTASIILILAGLFFYIQFALNNHDKAHEDASFNKEKNLINALLQTKIDNLNKVTFDVGNWDESVKFIDKPNASWAKSNLENLVGTFKIDYIWVYNNSGNEVYSYINPHKTPIPSSFIDFSILKDIITKEKIVHFYEKIASDYFEISIAAVKHESDNIAHGYIVCAKLMDKSYLYDLNIFSSYNTLLTDERTIASNSTKFNYKADLNNFKKENIGSLYFINLEQKNFQKQNDTFIANFLIILSSAALLLVILIFIFFHSNIISPLKKISLSLQNNSIQLLSPFIGKNDEFSVISKLIINFFEKEKELQITKNRLETIVKFLPDIITISDINSVITYVSPSAETILGYSNEELLNDYIYSFVAPESLPEYAELKKKLQNDPADVFNLKFKAQCKDSSYRWLDSKIINLYNNESIQGALAVSRDITANQQLENELLETKNRLKNILDTISDIIWSASPKPPYHLIYINKAAEKIFEISAEEIYLNPNTRDTYTHPEDIYFADIANLIADLKLTGHATAEYRLLFPDGRIKWLFEKIWLVFDKYNQPLRIDGIINDITEQKRSEIDLQKTMKAVELARINAVEANKAKTAFLANMSHEIRTPMNGVIGLTDLVLTTDLTDVQRNYLQNVKNSAYSLLDIINDILDFSKIEAGKIDIEFIPFNIFELIEKCIDIIKIRAHEKGIELLLNIDDDLPRFLVGDPIRLRQIVVNLLGNAVKFTEKGEICLSVKSSPLENNPNFTIISFAVKDSGIGIPFDKINTIFESFSQADNSTTRKYGGTGLGLTISNNLAQLMGGNITVTSKQNYGSEFTFAIQLAISEPLIELKKEAEIQVHTALIVDDNETNLIILSDMLEKRGITVDKSSSPFKALQLLNAKAKRDEHYDLIILDMQMPEMDGLSVAENIKYKLNLSKEPIIFMFSSIEKSQIIERCKSLGINRYLTKPVKFDDLIEVLENPYRESTSLNIEHSLITSSMQNTRSGDVLVVEDNSINILIISEALTKIGFTVHKAFNGREAFELFKERRYELIYMDVHMPIVDGFQATKLIRDFEDKKTRTPIIALTADAMKGDKEKCIAADMDYYISKPFRHKDILDSINKFYGVNINRTANFFSNESNLEIEDDAVFNKKEFIERIEGNIELGRLILNELPKEFGKNISILDLALKSEDYEKIRFSAHLLKGMCGNVSAYKLKKIFENIELGAKTNVSLENLRYTFQNVDSEFDKLTVELGKGI